jgi:hypothetical protein
MAPAQIFTKLGIGSCKELAAVLRTRTLDPIPVP